MYNSKEIPIVESNRIITKIKIISKSYSNNYNK